MSRHEHEMLIVALAVTTGSLAMSCGTGDETIPSSIERGYVASVNIFDPTAFVVAQDAARAEAENQVWLCMNEQGFEYEIGSRYSLAQNDPMAADLLQGDLTDLEFATKWGFGVGNYPDRASDSDEENPAAATEDQITASTTDRSDPEQVAYQAALDGTGPDDPGCVWEAYEEFRRLDAGYGDVIDEVLALQQLFAIEPSVSRFYADWSACMATEGYEYRSPLEAKLLHLLSSEDIPFVEEQAAAIATVNCGGTVISSLPPDLLPSWAEFVKKYR